MEEVFFLAESVTGQEIRYTLPAVLKDSSMQPKLTISVDIVRSALYVQLILKICISPFFKIV
jgi:hypothetical protein